MPKLLKIVLVIAAVWLIGMAVAVILYLQGPFR
jgi:hypothetical protein